MLLYRSIISSTITWSISGVFVAAMAVAGIETPLERIGTTTGPTIPAEEAHYSLAHQVSEIVHVEEQLALALNEFIEEAQSEELKRAFQEQHEQTLSQIDRLYRSLEALGGAKAVVAMPAFEKLQANNERIWREFKGTPTADEVLLAGAREMAQFEIICYTNLLYTAHGLGLKEKLLELLQENLQVETEMEKRLDELMQQDF